MTWAQRIDPESRFAWTVSLRPTFCHWCYDHDRYPYGGIRTCRICGHILEYVTPWPVPYSPWHGGGG